ncbi:MAG TPA: phosphoribosyltransferase family protein [Gaiellaceae bacterium]|nr:phosphoribosyltransferase family protein [Gaiellaceae bacterium]
METLSQPQFAVSGFRDRREAGRFLALELVGSEALEGAAGTLVVIGLARGGVEVAAEVAAVLHAPLDALAVRKVGHPLQPEYGIGAVAPGGIEYIRAPNGLTEAEVAEAVRAAEEKVAVLDAQVHEQRTPVSLVAATCILVDDGLATGGTMLAAVRWARAQGSRRVVVAVPVGAAQTVMRLERDEDVDAVICLVAPFDLGAVGIWYHDFHQVSDADVVELLSASCDRDPPTSTAEIAIGDVRLLADLTIPSRPIGWVVFAHGSGSSRRSPRNVSVAAVLNRAGMATVLFDLLTREEEVDRQNVFDIELLAERLVAATRWLSARPEAAGLPIAYFGASTGAAAALLAAAVLGDRISAVVSRGGRPDLASERLAEVRAPTLLIVGGADLVVLEVNQAAATRLGCPHELVVIPEATHLFEEPGALEHVASLAAAWFRKCFTASNRHPETDSERRSHGQREIARNERAGIAEGTF